MKILVDSGGNLLSSVNLLLLLLETSVQVLVETNRSRCLIFYSSVSSLTFTSETRLLQLFLFRGTLRTEKKQAGHLIGCEC